MAKESEFVKTAELILKDYLNATQGKILIVKDHESKIVDAFEKASEELKLEHKTISITINRKHSSPIPEILKEMLWADYIIAPTQNSITHCPETETVARTGKLMITLPGINEELFMKINNANLKEIEALNERIGDFMRRKDKVIITTRTGTEISFSIKNRHWELSGGATKDKPVVNAPTGESFCAPIEESANGIIYIDYWQDKIKPDDKAWIEVRQGKVVAYNNSAELFIKEQSVEGGLTIAEFGIGTNKAHTKPIGNILHDEKIFGTGHIAFGMNLGFGGKNESTVHSDIILIKPKITADGKEFRI